jgi:hypothetical protein
LIDALAVNDSPITLTLTGVAAFVAGVAVAIPELVWFSKFRRRRLRQLLDDTVCASCGYNLVGVPVRDMIVTCPECSESHRVSEFDLTSGGFVAAGRPVRAASLDDSIARPNG